MKAKKKKTADQLLKQWRLERKREKEIEDEIFEATIKGIFVPLVEQGLITDEEGNPIKFEED